MVPQLGPRALLDTILKRERWHGRGWQLGADAVYGVNDGLGAKCLDCFRRRRSDQQPATLYFDFRPRRHDRLESIDGRAGAYLAVKSEAEVYEAEIARRKSRGSKKTPKKRSRKCRSSINSRDQSRRSATHGERLGENPDQLVQAMAQSELGLSEHRFPSPWKSSASAAISTAIGAFIPIIPFSS